MVFCIVGLVVFGVLGIFSAKYRRYFRQSLHCIRRTILLKPCDTTFDQEMKAKLAAASGKAHPMLGRFIYRRFLLLSWMMIIVMIVSVALIGVGIYNYLAFGNCNGPFSDDFCLFNALGDDLSFEEQVAAITPLGPDDDPTLGVTDAAVHIVEVGCFSCPYTRDAESFRTQLFEKYGTNITFTFRAMPLPKHLLSWDAAEAANCALEQDRYWEYHDALFANQQNMSSQKLKDIALDLGFNQSQFTECQESNRTLAEVQHDYDEALTAGIFATPTYFVNGRTLVGLKAFSDFEQIVVGEIVGSCPE